MYKVSSLAVSQFFACDEAIIIAEINVKVISISFFSLRLIFLGSSRPLLLLQFFKERYRFTLQSFVMKIKQQKHSFEENLHLYAGWIKNFLLHCSLS